MKACLLLFFYFSFIFQLHGADVKIKQNESMMGSTAMTYDLSEEKLMKLKYKSQHGDSEASFRLYQYYGNDSNLLIVFYVQIMPDDFVMQLHR
ncbi:hypothetical protein MZF06_23780, partial [Escherichia coli]|nr:hypothetical protein [Escherichia coli]